MYLNKKSKILFLLINLSLIGFLLLNDPRSYLIAEPFDATIQAITIAISKLEYDVGNYLGLKEVYLHFKNIPHVANYSSGYKYLLEGSLLNFDSIKELNDYNLIIKTRITESLVLENINYSNIYIYQNDIGYPMFVTLSFYLFGYDVKSITVLFLLILFLSTLIFALNFLDDDFSFFLILLITFIFIPILFINFGGDMQTIGSINQRFLSILTFIPGIFVSLMIIRKSNYNIFNLASLIIQLILISLLIKVRGTSSWVILYLIIFSSNYLLYEFKKNKFENKRKFFIVIFVFISFFSFSKINQVLINNSIDKDVYYKNAISQHMVWHNIFIGISNYPSIYKNYVCLDDSDIIEKYDYNFSLQKCDDPTFSIKKNLTEKILIKNDDNHGLSTVVRYFSENLINKKLGQNDPNALDWNLDWLTYESSLKKIYFEIIKNHPLEYLYIHLVLKPLEILYNLIKAGYFFLYSFKYNLITNIFLITIGLSNFVAVIMNFKKKNKVLMNNENFKILNSIFISLLISFLSLPLLFYPFVGAAYFELLILLFMSIIMYLFKLYLNLKRNSD